MLATNHSAFNHHRMPEQNLLEFPRVNVGPSRDDHILRAILKCEEAAAIDEHHSARPEPTVAEDFGVGLRVIPISAHDTVGPGYHLPDFAGRHLTSVIVDDQNVDAAARYTAGGEYFLAARMILLAKQPL